MRTILSLQNRILAALLMLICLCAAPLCAHAADHEMTNLRVGYFAFDGYHNIAAEATLRLSALCLSVKELLKRIMQRNIWIILFQ